PANDNVTITDDAGQCADRQNDRQRRVTGYEKSQPDDIRFARAPVAIEQSSGAPPVEITGTVNAGVAHRPAPAEESDCPQSFGKNLVCSKMVGCMTRPDNGEFNVGSSIHF